MSPHAHHPVPSARVSTATTRGARRAARRSRAPRTSHHRLAQSVRPCDDAMVLASHRTSPARSCRHRAILRCAHPNPLHRRDLESKGWHRQKPATPPPRKNRKATSRSRPHPPSYKKHPPPPPTPPPAPPHSARLTETTHKSN